MQSRRYLIFLVIIALFLGGVFYFKSGITTTVLEREKPRIVIVMGQDLSEAQENDLMQYFGDWKKDKNVRIIRVSNSEERAYLEGLVEERLIGTRAISSAYVELLDKDKGIEVETNNITAITPFMFANALTTAGTRDARVIVAAPFEVSGTAALTGIIKAFEVASGEKLNENAKETAHQEIAETSELGQEIGQGNADKIIYEVKRQVIEEKTSDPEEIRRIILEVSADLNINLSEQNIEQIVNLMQKINRLNISIDRVNEQLKSLERNLGEIRSTGREAANLLEELLAALKKFIENLRAMIAWDT